MVVIATIKDGRYTYEDYENSPEPVPMVDVKLPKTG